MIIDGKKIAGDIIVGLKNLNRDFAGKKVVGILVGDSPDSLSFLRQKKKTASMLGIDFEIKKIKSPIAPELLYKKVRKITSDPSVVGAIVQLKIPDYDKEDTQRVLNAIPPEKDIDCLGEKYSDEFYAEPLGARLAPPAAAAVKAILSSLNISDLHGKKALIYGFGRLVGQPSEAWLRASGAEIVILRSSSTEEERVKALREADVIVTGVGKSGLVTGAMICPGTIVIDFGYPAAADAPSIDAVGGLVTPTPGGTGPILVAELFRNLYKVLE